MTEYTGRQRNSPMTLLDQLQAFLQNGEQRQQRYEVGTYLWHFWEDILVPLRRHLRALGVEESGDEDEPVC